MKKLKAILGFILFLAGVIFPQNPTGEDILKQIDKNLVIEKAISQTTMVIHGRAGTRSVKAKTWTEGRDKAFVAYTDPPREKGKKMLKLGSQIWNYIPEPTDRIITISGHLLRQSVMGSDLSYEDVTENRKLTDLYNAKLTGSEKLNGQDCYVVELTAKQEDITYYNRKLWVDKEKWLPLKEERYARSGKPLKVSEITEVQRVDNRWYPKKMTFRDLMQAGSEGTEYIIDSINFHVNIPEAQFTKAALKK